MKILYIHGFNGSGNGNKVEAFNEKFGIDKVIAPTLSYLPDRAIEQLKDIIDNLNEDFIIVGTSLGGYYSLYLSSIYNKTAILINPSINPKDTLKRALGKNINYNTNEVYYFDQEHLDSLSKYSVSKDFLETLSLSIYLDLGDEVIDSNKTLNYFKSNGISKIQTFEGGNHRFTHIDKVISDLQFFMINNNNKNILVKL